MKTIGHVEDNPDNRMLVATLLEDLYIVREYEDGAEAMEGLVTEVPDLVLLDISLPKMSGQEVLAAIRNNSDLKSLPVVALTAHAMDGDREEFLAQGFDAYVAKPILDEEDLFRVIRELLEGGDSLA